MPTDQKHARDVTHLQSVDQAREPSFFVQFLDTSEHMIQEARRRSEGTGLPVDYRVGDAQHLEFAAESFDGCYADRVLMYLEDPRLALTEMLRVARREGQMVVFDIDWLAASVNNQSVSKTVPQPSL